jgi:hypothetical protein
VILGQGWWNATRREAYRSTNFRCQACGVHKDRAKRHQWLEGHELYFTDYARGRAEYLSTVPLCHYCHCFIHDGRLIALVGKGELALGSYKAIINHGTKVLREVGIQKHLWHERDALLQAKIRAGEVAAWADWRLILFGKKYKPLYASREEWEAHYGRND